MNEVLFDRFKNTPFAERIHRIWGFDTSDDALLYGLSKGIETPVIVKFKPARNAKFKESKDAKGRPWFNIDNKQADDIVDEIEKEGFDVTTINNVDEIGKPSNILIVHSYVPIKWERIK